ncbi:MAG: hypothetical protein EZS28_024149 [Streblomastix strix]|uniref:Uncharacterized protein n=1 Tax=Streblomastix strix TaxID=222440 RepID=A0A5J4VD21_9EUKA|nr:MAG: hypothetical protein EZS28_024149 [Streblomastix strix]
MSSTPKWSVHVQVTDLWGGLFEVIKNSVKLDPPEPGLFANFELPKLTVNTPNTTTSEQPEMGDEIWKFFLSGQQLKLQDFE